MKNYSTLFLLIILMSSPVSAGSAVPLKPLGGMKCNGKAEFCDRRYDQVAQIRVHNATSITKDTLIGVIPNPVADQNRDIVEQLYDDGLRAFKLPIHRKGNEDVAWVTHALAAHEFDKYAEKYFFIKPFKNKLYAIDPSNQSLKNVLNQIKLFLDKNPHEVVTLFLDVQGRNMQIPVSNAFEESGIFPYMYSHPIGTPWPTFKEMVMSNQRLVVFTTENFDDQSLKNKRPWVTKFNSSRMNHYDNAFDFKTLEALRNDSCQIVTGGGVLFMMNHDVTPGLAGDAKIARQANSYDELKHHVNVCAQKLKGKYPQIYPNFIQIDFYDQNFDDLKKIIDEINALPRN